MRQELKKATEIDLDNEFRPDRSIRPASLRREPASRPNCRISTRPALAAGSGARRAATATGADTENRATDADRGAAPSRNRRRPRHGRVHDIVPPKPVGVAAMADDDREAELEEGRMPLLDHLIELRNRLMWSIGGDHGRVSDLLSVQGAHLRLPGRTRSPSSSRARPGGSMIYTGLTEAFFTYVKVVALGGALPRLSDRREPDLEVRRARPLQERAARVLALSFRDAGAVHHGRRRSSISS